MEDAALTSLPNDPQALKAVIATLTQERDRWKLRHDEKEIDRLRLEVELLRYKKWYYGRRADQLTTPDDVAQMLLSFGEQLEARPVDLEDVPADVNLANIEPRTIRRVKRGRRNLAAFNELPVTRKEHDLPEEQKPCPCCGQMRCRIGSESSWQIEYIPGRFERIEHIRHKYACKQCEANAVNPNIELADKPTQPIDNGLAGPGLLAFVVTSKFADYLPLYRLESIFERNGFAIDRATLSIWCRDVAEMVKPLYDLMVQRVLQSHVICTDDTVMPMLSPGNGKAKQGRMWIYIGDENHPYNLFDFTLSPSRDGPVRFLAHYNQTLLADGYGGYDGVVTQSGITRAGCWAHARRKFVDAEKAHPAIARDAVAMIKRLYAVEEQARSLSNEDRLHLRESQSTPILRELHQRLLTWKDQLLPKHPMAEAVNYTLNQWQALNAFATDAAVARIFHS